MTKIRQGQIDGNIVTTLKGSKDAAVNNSDPKNPVVEVDFDIIRQEIGGINSGLVGTIKEDSPAPSKNGMYAVESSGTYINFKDNSGNPIVVTDSDRGLGIVYIVFDGIVSTKLIVRVPFDGKVALGETRGVSGGEVYKAIPIIEDSVVDISHYIKDSTAVNTEGKASTHQNYVDFKSVVLMPLKPLTTYMLDNLNIVGVDKMFTLTDITDTERVLLGSIKEMPFVFTTTETAIYATFSLKTRSESNEDLWKYTSIKQVGIGEGIYAINEMPLIAGGMVEDNIVPTPKYDHNAVNLQYLRENGVVKDGMDIVYSTNKAYKKYYIHDKYVGNTGTIQDNNNATGWVMLLIPKEEFDGYSKISFGNFKIDTGGYYSFVDSELKPVGTNFGSTGSVVTSKTVDVPASFRYFAIDIARPVNTETDYANVIVNAGDLLLPFEEAIERIYAINEMPLIATTTLQDVKGVPNMVGNAGRFLVVNSSEDGIIYTESASIGKDLNVDTIKAFSGAFNILAENLSEWDEVSSTDLKVGDKYLKKDGNNYTIKVKGL